MPELAAAVLAADDAGRATGIRDGQPAGADVGGDPGPVEELRAMLRAAHARVWEIQVDLLLAAGTHLDRDHPRLWAWARQLHEDRLLGPADVDALTEPPAPHHRPRAKVEEANLARYRRDQAADITARTDAMSWRERRRFDPAAANAATDAAAMLVCDTCAVATVRSTGGVHGGDSLGDQCSACHSGRLLEYGDRGQVVALTTRLDELCDRHGGTDR